MSEVAESMQAFHQIVKVLDSTLLLPASGALKDTPRLLLHSFVPPIDVRIESHPG